MTQLSMSLSRLSSDNDSARAGVLMVRDSMGQYVTASDDDVMSAARQVIERKLSRGVAINSPAIVKEYLVTRLATLGHEVFAALFVDSQHQLIDYVELFRGTIDAASVYPREVVKEALLRNAAAVIFAHNHPSGMPEPSLADKALTTRLSDALRVVDIRVLDHIVVGGTRTASFAERGWI